MAENTKKLNNEELEKVSAGANGDGTDNWIWTSTYKLVVFGRKEDVEYIFNYGDKLKIVTIFGSGDEGTVVKREAIYSNDDSGWIDRYLVDTGDSTNYWCKRNVIVHP